jgi:hypothetical protein
LFLISRCCYREDAAALPRRVYFEICADFVAMWPLENDDEVASKLASFFLEEIQTATKSMKVCDRLGECWSVYFI